MPRGPSSGERVFAVWEQAHADLPALVKNLQPKLGELAKAAVAMVASIGGDILMFMLAFIVAGILMAFGQAGDRASLAIFNRLFGPARRDEFKALAVGTIRAVAQGVIGIAFIQAIAVGLCLLVAGCPSQACSQAWCSCSASRKCRRCSSPCRRSPTSGRAGTTAPSKRPSIRSLLFVAGMADNVLKPLMLGRGVDVPMPVVLLGALGGMASSGILGLFVGATLLGLGYKIFMGWVESAPEAPPQVPPPEAAVPGVPPLPEAAESWPAQDAAR